MREGAMDACPFNFRDFLEKRLTQMGREKCGFGALFEANVREAEPCFGDFQVNGVLAQGKRQGQNPRMLAEMLAQTIQKDAFLSSMVTGTVAGAGFVNLQLSERAKSLWLQQFHSEKLLQIGAQSLTGQTILVDYSCPNTAKQMHVGHLRSLVIGDSLVRLLKFLGAKVLGDNHLGDWGTQFGILLMQIQSENLTLQTLEAMEREAALEELEALYRRGVAATEASEVALTKAREHLHALQNGDEESLQIWEKINALSYDAFQKIYDLTDVQFDLVLGESFYRNDVNRVYEELQDCNVATLDKGALVVFHPEHPRFCQQAFLVRKSDGSSNYATTDLAALLYRCEYLNMDGIIYVTDSRQQDHFEQLFLTAKRWFEAKNYSLPWLKHVWFGTVCDASGQAIKTRTGTPIRLKELFREAMERAYAIVSEKNPQLSEEERRNIAEVVGVGAIKYGDLSQNRTSDYLFSWDKMLAFDGNTGPYLHYAVARIHGIFRKAGLKFSEISWENLHFESPEEQGLARKLMLFPVALEKTYEDLRPHHLCLYLYELASEFSAFYNQNRILDDENGRNGRLLLCARTLLILSTGMKLLGLKILEKM